MQKIGILISPLFFWTKIGEIIYTNILKQGGFTLDHFLQGDWRHTTGIGNVGKSRSLETFIWNDDWILGAGVELLAFFCLCFYF